MNQERNHSIDNQQVLKNCGRLDYIFEIRFTWQHKCPVIPITLETKSCCIKKQMPFGQPNPFDEHNTRYNTTQGGPISVDV